MVANKRESAFRSLGPETGRVLVIRIGLSQKIFVHLVRIADVVDISKVDRVMRLECLDQLGNGMGLVRAGRPIAGESDANLAGISLQ